MYKDPFTGKYHTHFRDYDPITCRWLSEDPAGYADGLNLYNAYMGVNGRDVLGLDVDGCETCEWRASTQANFTCHACDSIWRDGELQEGHNIAVSDLFSPMSDAQKASRNRKGRNTVEAGLMMIPLGWLGRYKAFAASAEKLREAFVLRHAVLGAKLSLAHEVTAPMVGDSPNVERGAQNWAIFSTFGMAVEGLVAGKNWVMKPSSTGAPWYLKGGRLNILNYEAPLGQVNMGVPTLKYRRYKASWSPESGFYEVGFAARLARGAHYPGVSDARHFQEANRQLHGVFQGNPSFAQQMEKMYPGIIKGVQPGARGAFPRRAPTKDVTWHHNYYREGILELVLRSQHKSAGYIQQILHPNQEGGMQNWGGGR